MTGIFKIRHSPEPIEGRLRRRLAGDGTQTWMKSWIERETQNESGVVARKPERGGSVGASSVDESGESASQAPKGPRNENWPIAQSENAVVHRPTTTDLIEPRCKLTSLAGVGSSLCSSQPLCFWWPVRCALCAGDLVRLWAHVDRSPSMRQVCFAFGCPCPQLLLVTHVFSPVKAGKRAGKRAGRQAGTEQGR